MSVSPSGTLAASYTSQTETRNIILLHGLFGSLCNWESVKKEFSADYKIHIPELPLFDIYAAGGRLDRLVSGLEDFIAIKGIENPVLIGNSLGGHIALLYTLKHPGSVSELILTGSSGLYEKTFSASFPRIKDYKYIRNKVEEIFHRKEVVKRSVVDKVYSIVQSNTAVISVLGIAKEARRQNLSLHLNKIKVPVLLIWGLQDTVTPPSVAHEFYERLPNARLCLINECGHVPMMEQPELFNKHLGDFLKKYHQAA